MMLSILPVAIVVFIVVIIIAIIMKGKKFVTIKFTYWLLLIYIGVLIISLVAASFVMGDSTKVREIVLEKDIRENRLELEKQLSSGSFEQIDANYLLKQSSFEYHQPSMKMMINGHFAPRIFIEKKEQDDGVIDAYAFSSGLYIDGVNFTERITLPTFSLNNNQFEISLPDNHEGINISMIKNEFTITQFIGGAASFFNPIEHNESIIYLRLPKSLTIQTEQNSYFLEYVNE
ncbi:hypothetical protein [Niallia endozanthoxylica]|uniref:Uncharacterized protein n=1 Tax=Niallia endozanthoxylica TaxID=2036016 RepID=A0A5J5HJA3_9BACI|nr:hypothetical protein [Niallia endozanthoxylica]KAA9019482.1 hypothetical protein F4V44_19220 [Niallia endozanthoxylica]